MTPRWGGPERRADQDCLPQSLSPLCWRLPGRGAYRYRNGNPAWHPKRCVVGTLASLAPTPPSPRNVGQQH
jgi:hypothetical protein